MMSTIETLYLWMAAAGMLAFVAGFSSGVWTILYILRRCRRQWHADREQPAAPEYQGQETPSPLTVSHSSDSFER